MRDDSEQRWIPRKRWDRIRLWLAAGTLLGLGAAVTAAAYLDSANVSLTPVGGLYEIAYVDPDGNVQQGNPDPYEIDSMLNPPIDVIGSEGAGRLELVLRNTGNTDSGTVTVRLESRLTGQPADDDGIVRDPFDVLVVSAWNADGEQVADAVDPLDLALEIASWPAGEDRTVALQFAYPSELGTPYYFGKDVRIGFTATGEAP